MSMTFIYLSADHYCGYFSAWISLIHFKHKDDIYSFIEYETYFDEYREHYIRLISLGSRFSFKYKPFKWLTIMML